MPSSCSIVVRNKTARTQHSSHKAHRRGRKTARCRGSASRLISDGCTTEASLCEWTAWFARFHTDPSGLYVPIGLRTVDCIVTVGAEPPRRMLCVREVAKFNGARGVQWMLISWLPGLSGVQFHHCDSLSDALMRLEATPDPIAL